MKTIAVIAYSLTIEYSLTVLNGIKSFFDKKNDVNLIVIPVKTKYSREFMYNYQYWNIIQLLKSDSIDAVIVVTNSFLNIVSVDELSKALECLLPKPVISVSTPLNLPDNKYTCVSCDNAYLQIVEHLTKKHSRKKIAFFSASLTNSPESQEREKAYYAALKAQGLETNENFIFPGDYTPKTCYDYIKEHYKSKEDIPFDALLCANDYMAVGCIGALHEIGVSIPEDICVVGFDDTEVAVTCNPTVSTINQQIAQTGFKAAEVTYNILEGKSVNNRTVIDSYPVYRQSCGCIAKNLKLNGYLSQNGQYINSEDLTKALDVFSNGLNDMDILTNHLNLTDSITNMNTFFEGLKTSLDILRVPLFSICTFDEPIQLEYNEEFELPKKANFIINVDTERKKFSNYFDAGGKSFNPYNSLLPKDIDVPKNGLFYMAPIFMKNKLYGYMLCKLPMPKYPLYAVISKILVNAFVNSYEFSRNDIERAKLVEKNQNLNFEAKTDELTQLFNRRGFQEYGKQLLEVSLASEKTGSILFCDLDGLKKINDTWGHETGDLAIKTEAKVLRSAFRDSDLIGRLSGDEFGVVAPGFHVEKIDVLRERLMDLNEEFSKEAKLPFTLSISIGAVAYDKENSDLKELLKFADKELYKEKKIKHPKRKNKK